MSVLVAEGLIKDYGREKGVFGVNLKLEKGQIVGFIGPNGAGKSTTLNIICGFSKPDAGTLRLFGEDVNWLNIHSFFPRIGVMMSEVGIEPGLSAKEIFREQEILLSLRSSNWAVLAQELDLDTSKPFGKLSLGNKKKVGLICSIMHDPELILLDEPTSGLDPLIQMKMMNILKDKAVSGASIFLSSHVLNEVQNFCDRIIMIKQGKIILENDTSAILEQALRLFRCKNLPSQLLTNLESSGIIQQTSSAGLETLLYTSDHEKVLDVLVQARYYDFYMERPSLEEMFLQFYK